MCRGDGGLALALLFGTRPCTSVWVWLQIGFSMATRHVVTKCPNRYGVNTVVLDPSGLAAHPALVVAGNLLVELGLVMGVYDADDLARLEFGDVLQPREATKKWYGPSRCELASCAADALCPHTLHVTLLLTPCCGRVCIVAYELHMCMSYMHAACAGTLSVRSMTC